jgi:Transposase domain (DUF772)
VFPDGEFADLFASGRGRPSMPAPVAASILTLQTLLDLSDAETAEAARCDLRWKVATGMALDDKGFHPSTLTYWRRRLARSARPHRINEAVRKVVYGPLGPTTEAEGESVLDDVSDRQVTGAIASPSS